MRSIFLSVLIFVCSMATAATTVSSGTVSSTAPLRLKAVNPGTLGNMLAFEDSSGCRYVVPHAFVPGQDVSINMRYCKGDKKLNDFLAYAKNVPAFEVGQVIEFTPK